MQTDEKRRKLAAAGASLLYVAMWVVLMLFVTCHHEEPVEGEGILINFGDTETGFGNSDMAAGDVGAPSSPSSASDTPDEFVTQPNADAPDVSNPVRRPDPAQNQPVAQDTNPGDTPPADTPRSPDRRALFPGRSDSQSASEGDATGAGNQGNPAGAPDGSRDGTGTSTSGTSFSLRGRSIMGALPEPEYTVRDEGDVVIRILVDQQGRVTGTEYESNGSTTNNSTLVAAARRAASLARFNVDETASPIQGGTITYKFRLRAD